MEHGLGGIAQNVSFIIRRNDRYWRNTNVDRNLNTGNLGFCGFLAFFENRL